jgi:NTP pyrophosphatase (non-canonical NTP hydrolase)
MFNQVEKTEMEEYQEFVEITTQGSGPEWALSEITAELGEVNELFAKAWRKGRITRDMLEDEEFINKLGDEIGDLLWSVVALCNECNLYVDDVVAHNIDKLNKRNNK